MTPKPHRFLLDRIGAYTEEAAAFVRRRRLARRPFARVSWGEGHQAAPGADTAEGRALFLAAAGLLDVGRTTRERRTAER